MPGDMDVIAEKCDGDCGVSGFQAWDAVQWQIGKGFYHNHEGTVYLLHAHCNSLAILFVMLGMLANKCKKWKGQKIWWWIYVHVACQLTGLMLVTVGFITAAVFHPNDRPLAHLYLKNPHSILGLILFILWWLNPIFGYLGYIWTTKGPFYFRKDDSRKLAGTICKKIHNLSGRAIFLGGLAQGAMGLAHNLYPEGAPLDSLAPFIVYFILLCGAVALYPYLKWLRTYYKKLEESKADQVEVLNLVPVVEGEERNSSGKTAAVHPEPAGADFASNGARSEGPADSDLGKMNPRAVPGPGATLWPMGDVSKGLITWSFVGLLGAGLAVVFALLLSVGAAGKWMQESVPLGVRMEVVTAPREVAAGEEVTFTLASLTDSYGEKLRWSQMVLEHGRRMHVVCVSSDFSSMGHVHPDDDGPLAGSASSFVLRFTFPSAGRWLCGVDALVRYDRPAAFWQSSLRHVSKHFYVHVGGAPKMQSIPIDRVQAQGTQWLFSGLPETAEDSQPLAADISGAAGPYLLTWTAPAKVVGRDLKIEDGAGGGEVLTNQETLVSFQLADAATGAVLGGFVPYLQVPVHVVAVHESLQHYMHLHGWHYEESSEIGSVGPILHRHVHPTVAFDASFEAKFYAYITLPWEGKWTLLCQAKRGTDAGNEVVSFALSVSAV